MVAQPERPPGNEIGEKTKVSLTIDSGLLEDLRTRAGSRPLSTLVNDLLHEALRQDRLKALVDELVEEAGPPSEAAYRAVLEQWMAGHAD